MIFLEPRLFPSAPYYLHLSKGKSVVSIGPYNKRKKEAHRYKIIDARGPLELTVPIGKPHGIEKPQWTDCPISTHDKWWHRHRTALESAYGRTPFFEFLIDKFNKVFCSPEEWSQWPSVIDLIRESNRVVCNILSIDTSIDYCGENVPDEITERIGEYWQVRQSQFGFVGGLSILDLIFNLGPEAALLFRNGENPSHN